MLVVDPDAIAREHGLSAFGAGRKALEIMRAYMEAGSSFSVETTLSGQVHFAIIRDARRRGYRIEVAYVGTDDVEINLERIRQRVAAGGHDVPRDDVLRRAKRSFAHAPETIALADNVAVFDNSGDQMLPIAVLQNGTLNVYREPPPWAEEIVAALRSRVE